MNVKYKTESFTFPYRYNNKEKKLVWDKEESLLFAKELLTSYPCFATIDCLGHV